MPSQKTDAKVKYSQVGVSSPGIPSAANDPTEIDDSSSDAPLIRLTRGRIIVSVVTALCLFIAIVCLVIRNPSPKTNASVLWQNNVPQDVVSLMDTTIDPCHDFYSFSCGTWIRDTEIPSDRSSTSVSFDAIHDRNFDVLQQVMENHWPIVGEYYESCMNMSAINNTGLLPLQSDLDAILKASTVSELMQIAGHLSMHSADFFTGLIVDADGKDATHNVLHVTQSGLVLPSRDYYLDNSTLSSIYDPYKTYISRMLDLVLGKRQVSDKVVDTDKIAASVIDFEVELAQTFVPKEDLRDPEKRYNVYRLSAALEEFPLLLGDYLQGSKMIQGQANASSYALEADETNIIISTPSYFTKAEQLVANTSLDTLKMVMWHQYLTAFGSSLPEEFIDAIFQFFGKTLSGQQERKPRWKVCIQKTKSAFPDLLGKYYFLQQLNEKSESFAVEMVERIEAAMSEHLDTVEWLDKSTKEAAKTKLQNVSNLIGHSKKKESFPFVLNADTFLSNKMKVNEYRGSKILGTIGNEVDREQWLMSAADVNAYYRASMNQMVFPAAILQPPFFLLDRHPAQNFGAIGSVIGHELTHGFDDSGRHFNGDGNMVEWWSQSTEEEFEKRKQCLVEEYASYPVYSSFDDSLELGHVNGNYTIGENIADAGGVKLSLRAFREYMHEYESEQEETMSRSTREKLFFLSYAQNYCSKASDEAAKIQLSSDPHSPSKWRVNGVLRNNEDFIQTFQCAQQSEMHANDRCSVW